MFRFSLLLMIFVVSRAFAGPLDAAYQEGAKVAQENQNKAMEKITNYNPSEVFTYVNEKNEVIKNYNENPSETKFYHSITSDSGSDLIKAGEAAYTYNENDKNNNASQAALKSFKKNPKIKIDPKNQNDPIIGRAKDIMENAASIATGRSSTGKGVDCKESKICRIEYSKKTCNESIRPIQRICEKAPEITTYVKDVVYPNCQSIVVTQGYYNGCPSGYREVLLTDMIKGEWWDDVRICLKSVDNSEGSHCYIGYKIQAVHHNSHTRRSIGDGRGTVPKKLHGHIRFQYLYDGDMPGAIFNESTNSVFISGSFREGQVVDLPFSEIIDQTFRFDFANNYHRGVMILYVDHINNNREANITWKESCRDV